MSPASWKQTLECSERRERKSGDNNRVRRVQARGASVHDMPCNPPLAHARLPPRSIQGSRPATQSRKVSVDFEEDGFLVSKEFSLEESELPAFVPVISEHAFCRLSKKNDWFSMRMSRLFERTRMSAAYKRKADKVQPVDAGVTDGSMPGGESDWKRKAMAKAFPLEKDREMPGKWKGWIVPKFSKIPKGSRLTTERIKRMLVGDFLRPEEREMLLQVLYNREKALAWDFSEMGRVKEEVAPPQVIETIDHKAWQIPGFPLPRALQEIVIEMLRERIEQGLLEPCKGPYRNPWFLVKKKNGKYRMVIAAMHINARTIRDANLPPNVEEFAEDFAGRQISSLIDFFSGYDQVELARVSRDLTGILTPLGLLRQTTLPQGGTNSVAQFVRIVVKILEDLIPHAARQFVDDIGVKGPRRRYGDSEVLPGVRRFVAEHIRNLDQTLLNIELAGATISGEKSQFCQTGIKIVGYVCDSNGRSPEAAKVIKIVEWPSCSNATEARAFLGVCVYYRVWIWHFAQAAAPIYRLLKPTVPFSWGSEQEAAMNKLKKALTSAPALKPLDYSADAGEIILAVDASLQGWGGCLMQVDPETRKRSVARYESGMWNSAEAGYDAGKRECRGLLKMLKKVRYWLYGVRFVVELDANTLVAQLNRTATDLPGALVTRWLAWIRLFDFEVRHVAGKKHTAADGLSRKPVTQTDLEDQEREEEIDDFIAAELQPIQTSHASLHRPVQMRSTGLRKESRGTANFLEDSYGEEYQEIARWLCTLVRPTHLEGKAYRRFKQEALKFVVHDRQLFRRASKNVPLRKVVDRGERKKEILLELHEASGHKGREGTYRRVADRYWWPNLYADVVKHVSSCSDCQKRDPRRTCEELHPTWVAALWEKIAVDAVHMPHDHGKKGLIVIREDLSGWLEAVAVANLNSETVADVIYREVLCRHGMFQKLISDGGPENLKWTQALMRKYKIHHTITSAYNPQANGMVERGHRPIVDALSKMTGGTQKNWTKHLPGVLWADRTTVRASTGMSPFRIMYGYEAVLPVELTEPTWAVLKWSSVRDRADLLALRARQFERRDADLEEAGLHLRRMRENGKEAFDDSHVVRREELKIGDLVLVHDTAKEKNYSVKLQYKWFGPYRVKEVISGKGAYILEELDGSELKGSYAGSRLKRFTARDGSLQNVPERTERSTAVPNENPRTELRVVVPPAPSGGADFVHEEGDGGVENGTTSKALPPCARVQLPSAPSDPVDFVHDEEDAMDVDLLRVESNVLTF